MLATQSKEHEDLRTLLFHYFIVHAWNDTNRFSVHLLLSKEKSIGDRSGELAVMGSIRLSQSGAVEMSDQKYTLQNWHNEQEYYHNNVVLPTVVTILLKNHIISIDLW